MVISCNARLLVTSLLVLFTSNDAALTRKQLKRRSVDIAKLFASDSYRWVEDITTNTDTSYYNYTGYNSFESIRSELYRLEAKYDFVKVEKFGSTYEKRDLLALHINKNKSDHIVLLNSLIHAREWITGCVTMNIVERLLTYKSDVLTELLNYYHFIIIPVLNPDGYHYTFTKNRMWRKNREAIGHPNCTGVDINRNFVYGFDSFQVNRDEADDKCSGAYRGTHALSTAEASALNTILIRNKHNMKYYIDYHSYGNMWTNAYGAHNWLPKNEVQLKRYREEAVRVLVKTIGGVWLSGNVYDVIYQANGIAVDHVHYFITPIAFTVEVGDDKDEFNPPDTRIQTYTISQFRALISQLVMLRKEIISGQYDRDRTRNWKITSMKKRFVGG